MPIEPARADGVLKRWNDDRGFGFITTPMVTGDIFAHISEFETGLRPVQGVAVSFRIEHSEDGRARAVDIRYTFSNDGPLPTLVQKKSAGLRPPRASSIIALLLGVAALAYVGLTAEFGLWVVGAYAVMSLITFGSYASDKTAATSGRWRIPEATLHFLALLCGWPGAIVAQELLRHKTRKQKFRAVFWVTVVLNLAVLVLVATPARLYALELLKSAAG